MIPMRLFVILFGVASVLALGTDQKTNSFLSNAIASTQSSDLGKTGLQRVTSPLSTSDQKKIQAISTSEWLGPLAPVAVSPFFGITMLAGISQFGGEQLPFNGFISQNVVLKNQYVFWVFLILTLMTSLPRLTKVSKPLAQAMDSIETYGGIITIIVLRVMASPAEIQSPETAMVVQMGFLSFSADVLLSIAAIINIVVINSIKFFFEVMVWLIPLPFVDALLEGCSKLLCAGLMAIYAYSPLIATVVNLILFAICAIAFNWTKRRVTYLRTMLTDPIIAMIWPGYGMPRNKKLTGFLKESFQELPAKSKIELVRSDSGWRMMERRWILPTRNLALPDGTYSLALQKGTLLNSVQIGGPEQAELLFSRRYNDHLDQLADDLKLAKAVDANLAIEI